MKPQLHVVGEVILPETLMAAAMSRRWIREVLPDLGDVLDVVQLLTSELVANAVKHGGGNPRVLLFRGDKIIRVEVCDRGIGEGPELRSPADDEVSGRGLGLVDRTAQAWGVKRAEDRLIVWFETGTI